MVIIIEMAMEDGYRPGEGGINLIRYIDQTWYGNSYLHQSLY